MGRHNFDQAVVMGTHTDAGKAVYKAALREFNGQAVVVEAAPEEEFIMKFVPTKAHQLLVLVLGTETAQLATEADAIDLLRAAINSGVSLVAEDEIVEFLLGLEEEVSWPTEPRVGELVCGYKVPKNFSKLAHDAGGYEVSWYAGEVIALAWKHACCIEIDRPFDAIPVPAPEPTITERVAAVAAEVKAAAKAAKKTSPLDTFLASCYKDEDGRYFFPKGKALKLVRHGDGVVQYFRKSIKAISGYLKNWNISPIDARAV